MRVIMKNGINSSELRGKLGDFFKMKKVEVCNWYDNCTFLGVWLIY